MDSNHLHEDWHIGAGELDPMDVGNPPLDDLDIGNPPLDDMDCFSSRVVD